MSEEAHITPIIIRWALQRSHLTIADASQDFDIPVNRLEQWATGIDRPTFRQAQDLARQLHIPFGYLFLSSPPAEQLPLPDLRTLGGQEPSLPSVDLFDVVMSALNKQEWYREYLVNGGVSALEFVGRYTDQTPAAEIAADIRDTLSLTSDLQVSAEGTGQFLTTLVRHAEQAGILVLRSGIVGNNTHRPLNISEFRGFAIADDMAPMVFINSRDALSARTFTLIHEVAHIWIASSGISNPDYRMSSRQQVNHVERLCNRTAANVLLPATDFHEAWETDQSAEENIEALRIRFKVSAFVILRQAFDLDLVSHGTYVRLYQQFVEAVHPTTGSGGGNSYSNIQARNSTTLTYALLGAVAEGRATYREASELLDMKPTTIDRLAKYLHGRGGDWSG